MDIKAPMCRIVIYRDEFPPDVWEEYCEILKESPLCYSIEMVVCESTGYYEDIEEDNENA